jgi:hypothetical protein
LSAAGDALARKLDAELGSDIGDAIVDALIKAVMGQKRQIEAAADIDPARAALYARVARIYGDRRDITRRVNWKALVALATASEPVRQEFEERIVSGECIGAADIKQRR